MSSKEHNVEAVFVALLSSTDSLAGITVVHHDTNQEAVTNCIVVTATRGNIRVDGPKGSDYSVEVEYRTPSTQVITSTDAKMSAIEAAIESPIGDATAQLSEFSYFRIDDQAESDRQESKSLRHKIRKWPVVAA